MRTVPWLATSSVSERVEFAGIAGAPFARKRETGRTSEIAPELAAFASRMKRGG